MCAVERTQNDRSQAQIRQLRRHPSLTAAGRRRLTVHIPMVLHNIRDTHTDICHERSMFDTCLIKNAQDHATQPLSPKEPDMIARPICSTTSPSIDGVS